ncbi:hypothetical protein BKA83DRAFT_106457, partial [Pisolithus microcarpus]
VPFGVTYRRLAWPLHKDDTLFRSGRPTGLNIYFLFFCRCTFQTVVEFAIVDIVEIVDLITLDL